VRILVLGPVRVVDADGVVQPLERRPRELLTLLALRAPDAITTDELVDLLWDDPPPSATKSLQSHLSRVRSALARAGFGPDAVGRSGTGAYRLAVERGETDVDEFAAARARGRELRRSGREEDAAASLRGARSCWRGPLELPASTAAAAVGARWRQELRRVDEERLAAMVDGGTPDDAVPELSAAVAHDPLDERLAELLVVALHRSGRRLEALRAYQSAICGARSTAWSAGRGSWPSTVVAWGCPTGPSTSAVPRPPCSTGGPTTWFVGDATTLLDAVEAFARTLP
jgi:DNA-binding SARP family transcriptional activator